MSMRQSTLFKVVLCVLLLYSSVIILSVIHNPHLFVGSLHFQVRSYKKRPIYQNETRITGTVAIHLNISRTQIPSHVGLNGSNWTSVEAKQNRSLAEKFAKHLKQTAFLKFRKQVDKYKMFNANTSILLHDGELTSHMFQDWRGRQTRPQLSPPMPTFVSCAIVGNSGVLLDSQCGHEIDEHEFVIRNNMAPVSGFENDVGANTGLMSINSELAGIMTKCLANKTCEPGWMEKLKGLDNGTMLWYSKVFSPASRQKKYYALSQFIRNHSLPLQIAFPSNSLSTSGFWKIKHASSGLMMLSIAATFCRNITLYGFYPFPKSATGRSLSYHYYDKATFKNGHDMKGEHDKLQDLNKSGILRVITDRCHYT